MMRALLIAPIRAYKFFLSPWFGQSCRFTPTCSTYAIEAIQTWGPIRGTSLALRRLTCCHPWCQGGDDPVPVKSDSAHPTNQDSTRCHTD